MTTVTDAVAARAPGAVIEARPAGFAHDLTTIAGRALRAPRRVERGQAAGRPSWALSS